MGVDEFKLMKMCCHRGVHFYLGDLNGNKDTSKSHKEFQLSQRRLVYKYIKLDWPSKNKNPEGSAVCIFHQA